MANCILHTKQFVPFEEIDIDLAESMRVVSKHAQDLYCYMLSFVISNQV